MSLFSPFSLREVTFPNRVAVSPMSQYAATDGMVNDWHLVHLGRFALGGAGLVFTEATGVTADGRRTPGDLGLWHDGQIEGLKRVADFIRAQGSVPGIQLGHAGRKASERRPWHGETPLDHEDIAERGEHPWPTMGPTDQPYGDNWHVPKAMTLDDISAVVDAFGEAARRADEAGFDIIEVYAAHGFLLHQFYSPLSNTRNDDYGGDLDGRMRLSVEVAQAIRANWPDGKALCFRLSATDWMDPDGPAPGWRPEDTVELAKALRGAGVDIVDLSTGGLGGPAKPGRMAIAQGFQTPYAAKVRTEADMPTMTVGFIWEPEHADRLIREGQADMVALARELLSNPNWTLHAARDLGQDADFSMWKPAFGWWLNKRERLVGKLGLREAPPAS